MRNLDRGRGHVAVGLIGPAGRPVDLDATFWDAIDRVTASGAPLDLDNGSEMINATSGEVVVIDDEARFRTESGTIVRFARHDGEKEFPGCD